MKFYKERRQDITEDWILEINGKQVPLEVLNQIWKPLLITLLLVNAYDMGVRQAQEYVKFFYWQSQDANNPYHCQPVQTGLYIDWKCINSTKGLNTGTINISALK